MYISSANLLKISEEFGTPTFVYELDQVGVKVAQLQRVFAIPARNIHYAMKANYSRTILEDLLKLGVGIDAVSPEEVLYALELGFKPQDIIFTANNLSDEEIRYVQEKKVLFNLGSLSELKRYSEMFPGTEVCLRMNPDVVAGSHAKVQTGGSLCKFGILAEDLSEAIKLANRQNVKVVGLHKHTGSGIKEVEKYLAAVDTLLGCATPELLPDLRFVDLGGGFYVPYAPEDPEIDYSELGNTISAKLQTVSEQFGRQIELFIEPGKFLVAECGHLLVQATTLKSNRDYLILGTNSGFNHLPRPVLYDAYHHISNLTNPKASVRCYDVVGNICETGDTFATRRELSEIREGDILAIHNAGAYCASMSSFYNLRRAPAEVCIRNNEVVFSQPRITIEEQVRRQLMQDFSKP